MGLHKEKGKREGRKDYTLGRLVPALILLLISAKATPFLYFNLALFPQIYC
jgi:hypothetical protein